MGAVGVDSRIDETSTLDESRDTLVASVDAELRTLTELASIEFSVDARLCFDGLLRSMLSGRDGAFRPGDRAPDFEMVLEAHRRPKNLEAAVVISDARAALAVATFSSL